MTNANTLKPPWHSAAQFADYWVGASLLLTFTIPGLVLGLAAALLTRTGFLYAPSTTRAQLEFTGSAARRSSADTELLS
jgi:hypothetical protein